MNRVQASASFLGKNPKSLARPGSKPRTHSKVKNKKHSGRGTQFLVLLPHAELDAAFRLLKNPRGSSVVEASVPWRRSPARHIPRTRRGYKLCIVGHGEQQKGWRRTEPHARLSRIYMFIYAWGYPCTSIRAFGKGAKVRNTDISDFTNLVVSALHKYINT